MMIRSAFLAGAVLLASGLLTAPGPVAGQEAAGAALPGRPLGEKIFRLPEIAAGLRRVRALLEREEREEAAQLAERVRAELPESGLVEAARAGRKDTGAREVLAALAAPVRTSCPTAEGGGDEAPLWGSVESAVVSGNEASVEAGNTGWRPDLKRLASAFVFPPILSRNPLSPEAGDPARGGLPAREWRQLQSMVSRGHAAGLAGTVYDNRDRGHSRLRAEDWPQLAFTEYSPAARAAGLDYGLNTDVLFDAVTFGNSSTAITGTPLWRSQARLGLTTPEGPTRLFQLYARDHLYVFPAHRDYGAESGPGGDLFPANTPYYLVSQGSSGSDRPFLVAVAAILAALKPEARAFLDRHGLVAPTVQMVFRRGLAGVDGPEDYMSVRAHPTVFRAEQMDLARMISLAQGLEAGTLPPMPCIRVQRQTHPTPRIGYFADDLGEALFDTPSAIARVWRSSDPERHFTLSAGQTRDPNGRKLRFHWRLLRGDPERVRIKSLDAAGSEVEITIGWHERGAVPGRPELASDRVGIAVFADNGATLSAPAFFSMLFPAGQRREYETLPDGTKRIAEIDYADPERRKRYSDPVLFPRRDWRDRYHYDEEGRLLGWTRARKGETEESFTRHGLRVLSRDALGRPERAEEIAYPARPAGKGRIEVVPTPTGRVFGYAYSGKDDMIGMPVPEAATSSE